METGDNFFSQNTGAGRILQIGSSNSSNPSWNPWDLDTTSRFNWLTTDNSVDRYAPPAERAPTSVPDTAFFSGNGGGSWAQPDPQLVCLRLGKRHDSENEVGGFPTGKRGRIGYDGEAAALPTTVPRCQVEGCHVALVNAKEYHKRHKVCEMHSKAPKVTVLGLEQRFCQQCSRFHAVSEFDDSKRSCRRRLAGHNERRRKSTQVSNSRNPSHGHALSLLSCKSNTWVSSSDLSLRSSAALRELIAENRAAILAWQLIRDHEWQLYPHQLREDIGDNQLGFGSLVNQHHPATHELNSWERFHDTGSHVTLDLMEAPSSAYDVSVTGKSKEDQEECSALWNSLEGPHVL